MRLPWRRAPVSEFAQPPSALQAASCRGFHLAVNQLPRLGWVDDEGRVRKLPSDVIEDLHDDCPWGTSS